MCSEITGSYFEKTDGSFEKTDGSLKAKMLSLFTRHPWLEKAKKTSCFFHAF